jgi:NADPH:quinone reductase-like Zn-dependent oxidoreductase
MTTPTHKALVYPSAGSDLRIEDVEVYKPGPGELLVEIRAAGLNPADWKVQTKYLPIIDKFPAILGSDAAGIVKEIGENVSDFAIGDRM